MYMLYDLFMHASLIRIYFLIFQPCDWYLVSLTTDYGYDDFCRLQEKSLNNGEVAQYNYNIRDWVTVYYNVLVDCYDKYGNDS